MKPSAERRLGRSLAENVADPQPTLDRDSERFTVFRLGAGALQGNSLSKERTRTMKRINKQLGIPIVAACVLYGGGARADAVTEWNAIMQRQ
jgi:hypothetical protein